MSDFKEIQDKWQKKWKQEKVFEVDINKKKEKFFINTPYPYISGSLHIGHARAVTEVDVYSRFIRMRGKNVLFPMAFHISGMPVLGISMGIKNGDEKKIAQYKEYVSAYVSNEKEVEKIVKSFEDPWKIVEFFIPKMKDEYASLGLGVDWRRSFTSGDVEHQKLVEWQFHKYKEKGYLMQGKYPVLYSKTLNNAVGEDDITDGDTDPVEKREFTLMKFSFGDSFLVTATLRPDTLFGQTNLWLNPDVTYVKAKVNGEKWIISKPCAEKLSYQDKKVEILEEVTGKSLLGKTCKAIHKNTDLLILPFKGCKPEIATGLVISVPSSAPYDYLALKELQDSPQLCQKYGLDHAKIKAIQAIPIIVSESFSEFSAQEVCKKMNITSIQQDKLIDVATKEVYKVEFHTGKLLKSCGKYAGKSVQQAQQLIVEDLKKEKKVDIFYEVSRHAVSRDGGEIIVAIMDNQWFLDFNAKGWKKDAKQALKEMEILPNKYRKQFEDVFEWLDKRPCARLRGIGTQLPFDKQWVIESLSDSTIYMSLYTIQDKLKKYKISGEQLTPEFFDYIFQSKGKLTDLSKKLKIKEAELKDIKDNFEYWYPFDQRHTFQPHLANHLSFMIFAHTACFPKDKQPKKISLHGMIISGGTKMSKSKGNTVTLMDLNKQYGADAFRAFLCNSTSVDATMNWQSSEVEKTKKQIEHIYTLVQELSKNRKQGSITNKSFLSKIESCIQRATQSFEEMNLREYSNVVLFEMPRVYQHIAKQGKDIPAINDYIFDRWVPMLAPLCPHYAEELWSLGKKKGFVSLALWPQYNEKLIDEKAEFIEETIENIAADVQEIQKLLKKEKMEKIKIIIAQEWKYTFMKNFKKLLAKERDIGVLIKSLVDKEHTKDITALVPALVKNPSKIPLVILTQKEENAMFGQYKEILEKKLSCKVEIELAEKSKEQKAANALPSKPALVLS
ncbi:MAG: leucine--tRNA ligase [bacterium]|nr:leucine--tRNA ligase [bacterium]